MFFNFLYIQLVFKREKILSFFGYFFDFMFHILVQLN